MEELKRISDLNKTEEELKKQQEDEKAFINNLFSFLEKENPTQEEKKVQETFNNFGITGRKVQENNNLQEKETNIFNNTTTLQSTEKNYKLDPLTEFEIKAKVEKDMNDIRKKLENKNRENNQNTNKPKNIPERKSINKEKIKKRKKEKILGKIALFTAITTIMTYAIAKGIEHHQFYKTNDIKEYATLQILDDLANQNIITHEILNDELNYYNLSGIENKINNLSPRYIEENLYKFFVLLHKDEEIMNLLTQRAFGMNFKDYLISTGFYKEHLDINGEVTHIDVDYQAWEFAQKKLTQKEMNKGARGI